jgi:hypothetical protein
MIALDMSGLPAFLTACDAELAQFDRAVSREFKAWTVGIFGELVRNTPQYTGQAAASWTYATGEPDMQPTAWANKNENDKTWSAAQIFSRGMDPAVGYALAKPARYNVSWRDRVYFANPADIAGQLEAQTIYIRPINLVNGHIAMIQHIVDKYGRSA